MGVEAQYQALPEDCELLVRARKDVLVAEMIQSFKYYAEDIILGKGDSCDSDSTPEEVLFCDLVRSLIEAKPDLLKRYFYAGSRQFDAIVFLLSPLRRSKEAVDKGQAGIEINDGSMIAKAVYGVELLHPQAMATQGGPIGLVPAQDVQAIANYLESVTYEQLHEHFVPAELEKTPVYKLSPEANEWQFKSIWDEFVGMRDVYRAATDHGEAMITVID